MMRYSRLLVLILIPIISCIKFKVDVPDEKELITDSISIRRTLDRRNPKTGGIDDKVSCSDKQVFAVIKTLNIEHAETLRWIWYDNNNKLVKRTSLIPVNSRKIYLEYFIAWDVIENDLFRKKPGTWSVVVRGNGRVLGYKRFKIFKNKDLRK